MFLPEFYLPKTGPALQGLLELSIGHCLNRLWYPYAATESHALEANLMTWGNIYGLLLSGKGCLQNRVYSMKAIM